MSVDLVGAARTRLVLRETWFASLACRLNPVPDSSVSRAVVDGRTMRYNAPWFESLTPAVQEAVVCGAVMRCALLHMTRRGSRDVRTWNEASAHVVNLSLLAAGFKLPAGCHVDERFNEMAVEQVFAIITKERAAVPPPPPPKPKAPKEQDPSDDEDDDEDEDEDEDDEQDGDQEDDDSDDGDDTDDAHDEDGPDSDDDDEDDSDEADDFDASSGDALGGVEDAPEDEEPEAGGADGDGSGDGEPLDLETDWNVAVQQATFVAQKLDALPEGVDRAAQAARRDTDWRPALARYFVAASDYAWTKPARRFVHQGLYLPGSHPGQLRHVYVVVDCSGSIDAALLNMFGGELQSILDTAGWPERVTVVYHNTLVTKTEELTDVIELNARGGGGTAFRPVLDHIDASGDAPDAVVWFTDMLSGDLASLQEPMYPVLWAVPMENANSVAPFGEIIVLEPVHA